MANHGMKYLDVPFEVKAVGEQEGIIEGFASTFGGKPDSYGDIVESGAFAKTIRENPHPIVMEAHQRAIGKTLAIEERPKGLWVRGLLNLDKQAAREVYSDVKGGFVAGMSIGYQAVKERWDEVKKIRYLVEVRLFEWSITPFPANQNAAITGVKAIDDLLSAVHASRYITPEEYERAMSELKALVYPEPDDATQGHKPQLTPNEPGVPHSWLIREAVSIAHEKGILS